MKYFFYIIACEYTTYSVYARELKFIVPNHIKLLINLSIYLDHYEVMTLIIEVEAHRMDFDAIVSNIICIQM